MLCRRCSLGPVAGGGDLDGCDDLARHLTNGLNAANSREYSRARLAEVLRNGLDIATAAVRRNCRCDNNRFGLDNGGLDSFRWRRDVVSSWNLPKGGFVRFVKKRG